MTPYIPSDNPSGQAPVALSAGIGTLQTVVSAIKAPEGPSPDQVQKREIIAEAHENFQLCNSYEQEWRRRALEELNFVDKLEHWTPAEKSERLGRPCLTFDRIGPSIDQVINNARQNPPEPKFSPVGGGADIPTAEILQGLLRNVEADSSAQTAYMTAYEHAVKIGRGWWRYSFDWESSDAEPTPESFLQKVVIKRIGNPFSIYPDPAAEEFDYSDMRWCIATEDLDYATYKDLYPESTVAGLGDFTGTSNTLPTWFPNGGVRVAEYWRVEAGEEKELLNLADGRVVTLADAPEGVRVLGRRKVRERRVRCYKINGLEILERTEWPGRWIPLIPVLGRELIIDGKRRLRGMVRPAMDANLSYDYMRSKEVEAVGLAPIAPWIVAEGQIEGYEGKWADANRKAFPFLEYKLYDTQGRQMPTPNRNMGEPAIQAITVAVAHADNDIKATMATWDASLGRPGPEFSGKAILAQQRQGDNAHFNFLDNLQRSMQHAGKVFLDLVPHVYNEARAVSIFDPDGAVRQVHVNEPFVEMGIERLYRLGKNIGRYSVVTGSGPSFASRRQQGASSLMEIMRTIPQPMTRALDLVIKALDIPDADLLADRLRPNDIQADREGAAPIPPDVQQQLAQQGQMIQALTEQLNQAHDAIENKSVETASKERVAAMEGMVKLLQADLKASTQSHLALMQQQFAAIQVELAAMRSAQSPLPVPAEQPPAELPGQEPAQPEPTEPTQ